MSERSQREYMRTTGFYFVLREYDRWEEDGELKEKVDNLVQYFLRDEEPNEDDPEAPESVLPPAESVQRFEQYRESERTPAKPLQAKQEEEEKEEEIFPFSMIDPDWKPAAAMDDLD